MNNDGDASGLVVVDRLLVWMVVVWDWGDMKVNEEHMSWVGGGGGHKMILINIRRQIDNALTLWDSFTTNIYQLAL